MAVMRRFFAILCIFAQTGFAMMLPSSPLEEMGVRTLEFYDTVRKRPVLVELWYPTDQKGPFDRPLDAMWIHPKEIRNASLSGKSKKYPLILMSHGHQGDRRDRSWLAERMVKEGCIVASVDHYGDTRQSFDLSTSLQFWQRPQDLSFALDSLEKSDWINDRIDFKSVGFIGYSLGGMTGLALAGAKAENVRDVVLRIKDRYTQASLETLGQIDFAQGEVSYEDPRIRAVLLICPAVFVYPIDTLKQIHVPVGLVVAKGDEVLPYQDHAAKLIKSLNLAQTKVMNEISHHAFLNRLSEVGKKLVNKLAPKDPPCCDRESVHKEVGSFAVEFFKQNLFQGINQSEASNNTIHQE